MFIQTLIVIMSTCITISFVHHFVNLLLSRPRYLTPEKSYAMIASAIVISYCSLELLSNSDDDIYIPISIGALIGSTIIIVFRCIISMCYDTTDTTKLANLIIFSAYTILTIRKMGSLGLLQ